jgi:hypothetical protein
LDLVPYLIANHDLNDGNYKSFDSMLFFLTSIFFTGVIVRKKSDQEIYNWNEKHGGSHVMAVLEEFLVFFGPEAIIRFLSHRKFDSQVLPSAWQSRPFNCLVVDIKGSVSETFFLRDSARNLTRGFKSHKKTHAGNKENYSLH